MSSKTDKISDYNVVTKSNKIITARYKLSLLEQKFVLLMASLINPKDTDFKFYEIPVRDIAKILNLPKDDGSETKRGSIYKELRTIVKDLSGKPIIIREPDGEVTVNWVASMKVFNSKSNKKGVISFEFSERLKPYLLQLKKEFTTYKLKNIVQLRSSYSIRIYEILKQYEKIGKREVSVSDMRYLLGIEEDEYKLYGDFKRKVLMVAYKEINERTDIKFEFEELKEERRVVGLKFYISPKEGAPKQEELVEHHENEFPDVYNKMLKWGLSRDFVDKLILLQEKMLDPKVLKKIDFQNYSFEDYLKERVAYFEELKRTKGDKIKDNGAYLRNIIVFNQISDHYQSQLDRLKKARDHQEEAHNRQVLKEQEQSDPQKTLEEQFIIFRELSEDAKLEIFEITKKLIPSHKHSEVYLSPDEMEEYLQNEFIFSQNYFWVMKRYSAYKKLNPGKDVTAEELSEIIKVQIDNLSML